MPPLLIAGIDPGTSAAYALLDLDGNLVAFSSSKNKSPSQLVSEMRQHGSIVYVASDVTPHPNALKKVASSLGAKVIEPDHNPSYMEKIKIVDEFLKKQKKFIPLANKHEKDALAGALFGYKLVRPLLKKIDDHLHQHNKYSLRKAVRQRVIVKKEPITRAVRQLQQE